MASKRSAADSPSDSKKRAIPANFFGATSNESSSAKGKETDAEFARRLAKEDGVNIKQLKREEKLKGKKAVRKSVESDDSDDCIVIEPIASSSKLPVTPKVKPVKKEVKLEQKSANVDKIPPTKPTPSSVPPTPKSTTTASFFASPTKSAMTSKSSNGQKDLPLDTNVYAFSPRAIDTSSWPQGRIPYSYLVTAFVLLSSTKSRLLISTVLTNLLRTVVELDPESLVPVVQLCSNSVGSASQGLELGIGSNVLTKAIANVSGKTPKALSAMSKKLGDPGDVAFEATKSVRLLVAPPILTAQSFYNKLLAMCALKGSGSQAAKIQIVEKLLVSTVYNPEESRYLVRTLIGNLRTGAVKLTLTSSLARAFSLSKPIGTREDRMDEARFFVTEADRSILAVEVAGDAAAEETGKGKGKGKSSSKKVSKSDLMLEVEARVSLGEKSLRKVWSRHPNYAHLIEALLEGGLDELEERVPLAIGTPLQPMLGTITRSLDEVFTRLGSTPFQSEAKLDGQRGQIHVSLVAPEGESTGKGRFYEPKEGEVGTPIWCRIFSRHLEDSTGMFPDILPTLSAIVARDPTVESFILDTEICAIHPKTSAIRSFQELSYRSKKAVEVEAVEIRAGVFAFDLMYLNGESLLSNPFRRRRDLLHSLFQPIIPTDVRHATFQPIPYIEDTDPEAVSTFFHEMLKLGAEGIMVKSLDSASVDRQEDDDSDADVGGSGEEVVKIAATTIGRKKVLPASYECDVRAASWLKVKKDYLEGMGDSLDLVPVGAWSGSGRKREFWSPILLACYDAEEETYVPVCKIMSGFSDAFYKDLHERYAPDSETTSSTAFEGVSTEGITPQIWFKPSEVWEIRGADFTLSPVYLAGQRFLGERGVSVRFPRFIKLREDKAIENATTAEQLAQMYRDQGQPKGGGIKAAEVGDDEEDE